MKTKIFYLILAVLLPLTGTMANNMLVQNVTTTGNSDANKTIQVQFDISWDNSWRDDINWDAAWIFIKFKDSNGLWQHAKLNTTGFTNGTGTANTIQVTSDNIGAWFYRSAAGAGTFGLTGVQLQWNYGLSGLTTVNGLEVRVFAVEMVYIPQGDFNVAKQFYADQDYGDPNGSFYAPGNNFPVINTRLSPTLTYSYQNSSNLRIKGDAGIDTNNDGVVDNTTFPIGYRAFYCYKFELSEQQYADFLNTLTASQITTLGVAGSGITATAGQYFSSTPNLACGNSNPTMLLAYADWSGLRPMTLLEFNKASYGPEQPIFKFFGRHISYRGYPAWGGGEPTILQQNNFSFYGLYSVGYLGNSTSDRIGAGLSFYGVSDLTLNAIEPVVKLNPYTFTATNGNGQLLSVGTTDITTWSTQMIMYVDQAEDGWGRSNGMRFSRSVE